MKSTPIQEDISKNVLFLHICFKLDFYKTNPFLHHGHFDSFTVYRATV